MYWEEADHHRPHFHAEYAGGLASVAFDGDHLGRRASSSSTAVHPRLGIAASGRTPSQLGSGSPAAASADRPADLTFAPMSDPPLVHISGVAVIGPHKLRLLFEDGTVGDVSFSDRE